MKHDGEAADAAVSTVERIELGAGAGPEPRRRRMKRSEKVVTATAERPKKAAKKRRSKSKTTHSFCVTFPWALYERVVKATKGKRSLSSFICEATQAKINRK